MENLIKLKNTGINIVKNLNGSLNIYLNNQQQELNCSMINYSSRKEKDFSFARVSKSGNFLYLYTHGVEYAFWIKFKDGRRLLPEPQPDIYEINEFNSVGSLHLNWKD